MHNILRIGLVESIFPATINLGSLGITQWGRLCILGGFIPPMIGSMKMGESTLTRHIQDIANLRRVSAGPQAARG